MNKYLSKANEIFGDRDFCQFIYVVYRHGLAHTNMPKVVAENGKIFGWNITFDVNQHLKKTPGISGKSTLLSISPKKLVDEVIFSIDEYVRDLQVQPELLDKFKEGFVLMATTSHYLDNAKKKKLKIPLYLSQDECL